MPQLPWDWLTNVSHYRRPHPQFVLTVNGKVLVRAEAYNEAALLLSCLRLLPKGAKVQIRRM